MKNNNLPGLQIGAFRFQVESVIFQGILNLAKEKYSKLNPSKKWFIWLQDNYAIIKYQNSNQS